MKEFQVVRVERLRKAIKKVVEEHPYYACVDECIFEELGLVKQ